MPTIIRPNRSAKPVPVASTHLQALEKKINASNCDLLSDLLDINCSPIDDSPPEPTIPPPAPPSFIIELETRIATSDQRSRPSAEALYDYSSSHSGDLNFKVMMFDFSSTTTFQRLTRYKCNAIRKGTESCSNRESMPSGCVDLLALHGVFSPSVSFTFWCLWKRTRKLLHRSPLSQHIEQSLFMHLKEKPVKI